MQSTCKETGSSISCEYLNFSQLSMWLGVSEKFLRKHNARGRIPGSIRMGSRWMFRKVSIEKQLITHGQLLLEEEDIL
jgi:predicted site-specific integrase-resolvase